MHRCRPAGHSGGNPPLKQIVPLSTASTTEAPRRGASSIDCDFGFLLEPSESPTQLVAARGVEAPS